MAGNELVARAADRVNGFVTGFEREKLVVLVALVSAAAVTVIKFVGYLITGSSAMLSETYHTLADTATQLFLLFGIYYSEQEPTRKHPLGYGQAAFFYSFLVSISLFIVAGWASVRQGYYALTHPAVQPARGTISVLGVTFPEVYTNYAILVAAIVFEVFALHKAFDATYEEITEHKWGGLVEAFGKSSRASTQAELIEDSAAVGGIVIALGGLVLTDVTGNPVYDAVAALLIGLLLMGMALLLGLKSPPPDQPEPPERGRGPVESGHLR